MTRPADFGRLVDRQIRVWAGMDAALRCEVCGNDYRRVIQVTTHEGDSWFFDSFECAIQMLAPVCARCGTKIMGHGAETSDGLIYCGAHCARNDGQVGLVDRQGEDPVGLPPGEVSAEP